MHEVMNGPDILTVVTLYAEVLLFAYIEKKLWKTAYSSIGQKRSFICSQVDSFTPEKGAIHIALSSHSYRKWSRVPKNDVRAKPNSSQVQIVLFIIHLVCCTWVNYIRKSGRLCVFAYL